MRRRAVLLPLHPDGTVEIAELKRLRFEGGSDLLVLCLAVEGDGGFEDERLLRAAHETEIVQVEPFEEPLRFDAHLGFEPLRGAPSCVVYVPAGSLSSYMSDYEWQYLWSDGKVKEAA